MATTGVQGTTHPMILDTATLLKDTGLVAASAAAQVDSADKILDMGSGLVEGFAVIDISAIEVATGDESYRIEIQGSSSATFASDIVMLAICHVGDSSVTFESADSTVGRYAIPFRTERNGTIYRYVRAYTRIAGTIATGINYEAFVTKKSSY